MLKAQLAKPAKDVKRFKNEYYVSVKLDGVRLLAEYSGHELLIYSRNQKPKDELLDFLVPDLSHIRNQLKNNFDINNFVLDGELLLVNSDGKPVPMTKIMHLFGKKNEPIDLEDLDLGENFIEYCVFDIYLPDTPDIIFKERNKILRSLDTIECEFLVILNHQKLMNPSSLNDFAIFTNMYVKDGYEGLVARTNSAYRPGSRSNDLIKMKAERKELTCLLVDYDLGEGQNSTLFSKLLWAVKTPTGSFYPITSAASGLDRTQLEELTLYIKNQGDDIIADIVFDSYSLNQNKEGELSLRFPVISSLRYDLEYKDVSTLDVVSKIEEVLK
jgi:ATP-dependent DNA ligase